MNTLYLAPDNPKTYTYNQNHEKDAGFNVFFEGDYILTPFKSQLISLKIKATMHNQFGEGISYMLVPRSSISKTSFIMHNSVGIIDAGYTGELKVPIINFSNKEELILSKTSLFQIVAFDGSPFNVEIVSKLPENTCMRGADGFGSTNNTSPSDSIISSTTTNGH